MVRPLKADKRDVVAMLRCATSTMQKIDTVGGINMEPRRSHFIFQSIRVNFCNGGRALDRLIPAV